MIKLLPDIGDGRGGLAGRDAGEGGLGHDGSRFWRCGKMGSGWRWLRAAAEAVVEANVKLQLSNVHLHPRWQRSAKLKFKNTPSARYLLPSFLRSFL